MYREFAQENHSKIPKNAKVQLRHDLTLEIKRRHYINSQLPCLFFSKEQIRDYEDHQSNDPHLLRGGTVLK